eukprot:2309952-Pyramimonas_sp.AAC.1
MAMSPVKPDGAAGPFECFGTSPVGCWCSQHSVEYHVELWLCSLEQMKQVALRVLATVAPEHATGRRRTACRRARCHLKIYLPHPHFEPASQIHQIPLQAPPLDTCPAS